MKNKYKKIVKKVMWGRLKKDPTLFGNYTLIQKRKKINRDFINNI